MKKDTTVILKIAGVLALLRGIPYLLIGLLNLGLVVFALINKKPSGLEQHGGLILAGQILGGAVMTFAGVSAVRFSKKAERAVFCWQCGVAYLVTGGVMAAILCFINGFYLGCLLELVLPGVYFMGAQMNRTYFEKK